MLTRLLPLVCLAAGCGAAGDSGALALPDATAPPLDAAPSDASPHDGGELGGGGGGAHADASHDAADAAPSADLPGWTLTWSDEFDGPDGSEIDTTKWNYDIGIGEKGWGNSELEYYVGGTANAVVRGGALVITGTTEGASKYKCAYGTCQYVSARITTSGKFAQQYGRFEARIEVPRGSGVWPAFWMLGQDFPTTDWPECGEIDVMENIGSEPAIAHGTTHGPGPAKYVDEGISGSVSVKTGALADAFHVYATEWEAGAVRFYFDGTLYKTVTPADLPSSAKWVFDHPFFLLLNFAIGGDWPGTPDGTTSWPQTMTIDYVRAYRKTP